MLSFNSSTRREVISRIDLVGYFHDVIPGPSGFVVSGRAQNNAPWKKLSVLQNIEWTEKAQRVRFWIHETQPLQAIRFSNLQMSATMMLSEVILYGEQMDRPVPPFQYPSRTLYVDTDLEVMSPPSPDYYNFTVTPSLPEGLHLNAFTGEIAGTPAIVMEQVFTIAARRFDGSFVGTVFSLKVNACANDHAAYRLILNVDRGLTATWWALYPGQTTDVEPIERHDIDRHEPHVERHSFCLPDGYTGMSVNSTVCQSAEKVLTPGVWNIRLTQAGDYASK